MATCTNCGASIVASEDTCPTCGEHVGFPNVRTASDPTEEEELRRRYVSARDLAKARGAESKVDAFETAVRRSRVVVNCDLYRLRELASDERSFYTNYHLTVRAQVRQAARDEYDRHRRAVDAIMFGGYAEQIVYGALSLDANGLSSYGAYALMLRDVAVEKRTSFLEENSYSFVKHHDLRPGGNIPSGFRAVWGNRHQLAVAKLADFIESATPNSEFPKLLLSVGKDRNDDRFIEAHVYGTFNLNAVEAVSGPSDPKRLDEKAVATVVKELVVNAGKTWADHD